ncbi:hypothetical protein B566_EDAN006120 [Ephemera danica]|nr:hypothetical protein B566_EDAN006120 [Ephemera danica]
MKVIRMCSREKMVRGVRRGCVRLKGAVIGIDDEDDSTFTVTVDSKTFHFQARDADERETWVRALEDTILRHAQPPAHRRWDPSRPAPTVQDFDKKLIEADAYLQIIIDQVKTLEERMQKITDEHAKAHCEIVKTNAEEMLENVKHSIALLQIAKSTAHPINGIYQGPVSLFPQNASDCSSKLSPSRLQSGASLLGPGDRIVTLSAPTLDEVQPGIELGAECMDPSINSALQPSMLQPVPDMSYSSSEDEDFFDAYDYSGASSAPVSPTGVGPQEMRVQGQLGIDLGLHPHPERSSETTQMFCVTGTYPVDASQTTVSRVAACIS